MAEAESALSNFISNTGLDNSLQKKYSALIGTPDQGVQPSE